MTAGDVEEAAEADSEHVPIPHACTTIQPVLDPHPQALPLIAAQKAPPRLGMPHVAPSNPYGLDQVPWHKDHRWDRNRNFPQFLEFSSCFGSLPRDEWVVLCACAQ
ncbi:hypothetical protein EV1_033692 [Malus domestica]